MMINLTREEAQQVLDALINAKGYIFYNALDDKGNRYDAAADILRAKLSEYPDNFIDALKFHTAMQELEPEPVATQYKYFDAFGNDYWTDEPWEGKKVEAERYLYAAPPQREWVGLTLQEIEYIESMTLDTHDAIRMAAVALQEKNYG